MDAPWSYEAWKASAPQFLNDVEKYQELLRLHTKGITAHPYNPEIYLERSQTLKRLGYPELAVADAYKALLLCKFGLDKKDSSPKVITLVRQQFIVASLKEDQELIPEVWDQSIPMMMQSYKKSYDILQISLLDLRVWPDIIKVCVEGLAEFPGDPFLTSQLEDAKVGYRKDLQALKADSLRSGRPLEKGHWGVFRLKDYPWIPIEMCTRSEKAIVAANKMLQLCSKNMEIKLSLLTDSTDNSQFFGMFAKTTIRKGDTILNASTPVGVSIHQTSGCCYNCTKRLSQAATKQFDCCPKMRFCSDECLKIGDSNYHRVLCGKNFDKIYEGTGPQNLEIRLYLRLLAMFVQAEEHPLENQYINWMVPLNAGERFPFSLDQDIIAPIQILQELGIDLFDAKYESWVLFNVWNRLHANRQADSNTITANPMYSFFNHSCDPNASQIITEAFGTSKSILGAAKDIKQGEEVFVTYGPTLNMPRNQRWEVLTKWVGSKGYAPSHLLFDKEILSCRQVILEATDELNALMRGPIAMLMPSMNIFEFTLQAIQHFRLASCITKNRGEATFAEIASSSGLDETQVKRILRSAMTYRIFEERRKGVVSHTAASKLLAEDPGLNNFVGFVANELWPATSGLTEAITKWGASDEPNHSGFNIAYNTNDGIFKEIAKDPKREHRFAVAMDWSSRNRPGLESIYVVENFPWDKTKSGVVVDVGGSQGSLSIAIADKFPTLHCVVQDRLDNIKSGKANLPIYLKDRVTFMEHDFFTTQPVQGADVYFLRWILHDWPDTYAIRILKALVPALKVGSKVILNERLIPEIGSVSKYEERNFRDFDIAMWVMQNGKERDMDDWMKLFENASKGFKFVQWKQPVGSELGLIEFEWHKFY